jgi:opacity protein-like surface antigen
MTTTPRRWPSKLGVSYFLISFLPRSVGTLMYSRRLLPSLVFLLLTAVSAQIPAAAQTVKNLEAGVNIFGQFTGNTSGNGVTDSPTDSMGVLVNVRQSFHPWLGYEVNYSYTRFSERYNTILYSVQDNVHEVSGAYLVQIPKLPILGLQPFAAAGVGAVIFLPTTVGGQRYDQQWRTPFLYEFGVNYPILTSHIGLRFQYRGLIYKTPDFQTPLITTNATRQTAEPSVGAYFHF